MNKSGGLLPFLPLPRGGVRERNSRSNSGGSIGIRDQRSGIRGQNGALRDESPVARGATGACYDARPMRAVMTKSHILPEVGASAVYDPACTRCARLADFLATVRADHPNYFCRPVPPFGAPDAALVIVGGAILALGRIAHDATLRALGHKSAGFPFAHGARHPLARGVALFDSYHCSRYNTNTKRLTPQMFHAVFDAIADHLRRQPG